MKSVYCITTGNPGKISRATYQCDSMDSFRNIDILINRTRTEYLRIIKRAPVFRTLKRLRCPVRQYEGRHGYCCRVLPHISPDTILFPVLLLSFVCLGKVEVYEDKGLVYSMVNEGIMIQSRGNVDRGRSGEDILIEFLAVQAQVDFNLCI